MAQTTYDVLEQMFNETSPLGYYRSVFPQGSLEPMGVYRDGAYCAIAITIKDDGKAWRTHITDGLEQLPALIEDSNFTMLAPVSFAGKQASNANARFLYALEFDLDFIRKNKSGDLVGMRDLFYQTSISQDDPFNRLPRPTYVIASSSRNLHIVYLLEKPIALYSNVVSQVRQFRKAFIPKLWNSYITEQSKHPQYEISPVQAFRLCGSKSKDGSNKVRCFKTGERVTLETMNSYVDEDSQITETFYQNDYTIEEAKELFPDWYQKRIVDKLPAYSWQAHRGLYEWWKNRLPEIEVGHRYHYLLCMGAYAIKCGISKEELTKDVMFARRELDKISPIDNPLTISEAMKALQSAVEVARFMKRETISNLSGLEIKQQKRNGRKQTVHLATMRAIQSVLYPNGEWRYKGGAPTKKDLIFAYLEQHPKATIRQTAQDLGISKTTVQKWAKIWRSEQGN